MNGQFKLKSFDKEALKTFAADLEQEGISLTETWKKGTKKVEGTNEKANFYGLETNGKWFFRQVKNNGHVRFKHLSPEEEKIILRTLKKHHFYTDPNWALGIGLTALYVIVEFLFGMSLGDIGPILMICCAVVVLFLWLAYERSRENINEGIYKISMFLGGAAYFFTAIASMLAIPLFINLGRNHLRYKVLKV